MTGERKTRDKRSAHLQGVTATATATPEEVLWTVEACSAYLGVPVATLYAWRSRRQGPPAYRIGRWLRYRRDEVAAWVNEQAA